MTVPSLEELGMLHERICKAVGDPRRIQILYALQARPHNVSELAEELGVPQSTVSRHLTVLRQSSLVLTQRSGTSITYSLADAGIVEVLDRMRRVLRDAIARQPSLAA
ncbi:MAG TPA: metalloregulator ArsR/SmtB family transcription factor [Anaerolineales bacterium]|nr:metalloregulator ArsR/SmtB family transcription factor [Anaerolineales bacterium]